MPGKKYITSSSLITEGKVILNGDIIFSGNESDTGAFLVSLYKTWDLKYPKFYKMDNLSRLGLLAAEILLSGQMISEKYNAQDIGVVLSNNNASLDSDKKYFSTLDQIASPALFVYTLPNIMTGEICIRNKFKGENAFFISPEFDASFITSYVSNLFSLKVVKACITGWVECLDDCYKAALWLVEENAGEDGIEFNEENINKLYSINNG